MVDITVYKQSNFPVSAAKIKQRIKRTLKNNGLVSDFELSVALVGDARMDELVKEYYQDDPQMLYDHPILTFPDNEIPGQFVFPPTKINHLGEMIISYPSAVARANESGKLVEEVICDLAEHGTLHLLGIHHDH